ncbi:MAG: DUF5985 family protein [Bdellovibrionota bacterium]
MTMTIATIVYFLCAVLSSGCAFLLFRGYRRDNVRLLLWSSLCFMGLALNNILFFVDVVIFPDVELWGSLVRNVIGAGSGSLLLYGFLLDLS